MTKKYIVCCKCSAVNKSENTYCIKCKAVIDTDIVLPDFEQPDIGEMIYNIPGSYLTEAGKIAPDISKIFIEPEEDYSFVPEPDEFGLNGVLPKNTVRSVSRNNAAVLLPVSNNSSAKLSKRIIAAVFAVVAAPLAIVLITAGIINSGIENSDKADEAVIAETIYLTSETVTTPLETTVTVSESETTEEIDIGTADITIDKIQLMNAFLFSDLYGFDTEKADEEDITEMCYLAVDFTIKNVTATRVDFYPKALTANSDISAFNSVYYIDYQTEGIPFITKKDCTKVYPDESYYVTVIFKISKNEISSLKNISYDLSSVDWYDNSENADNPLTEYDIDISGSITDDMISSLNEPPLYSALTTRIIGADVYSDNNVSLVINETYMTSYYDTGDSYSINMSVLIKNRTANTYIFPINCFSLNTKSEYDNVSYENYYSFDSASIFEDDGSSNRSEEGYYFELKPGETKEIWLSTSINSIDENTVLLMYTPDYTGGNNSYYPYNIECDLE